MVASTPQPRLRAAPGDPHPPLAEVASGLAQVQVQVKGQGLSLVPGLVGTFGWTQQRCEGAVTQDIALTAWGALVSVGSCIPVYLWRL